MKSLSNNFSSNLHLYKARTPQAKMQQGHAAVSPKPPLMTTKDKDLVQEVFKTMLQPRETGLGSKRGLRRLRIESVERERIRMS